MSYSGEIIPDKKRFSRREAVALTTGVVAGFAVASAVWKWQSIEDFVVGLNGPQARGLDWIKSPQITVADGVEWAEYKADPDAFKNIQATWGLLGTLVIQREAYEGLIDDNSSKGHQLQQAFAYDANGHREVGIARKNTDPSIFGLTEDEQSFVIAGRVGHGVKFMAGGWDAENSEFIGIEATDVPVMDKEQYQSEYPHGAWV